MNKLDRILEWIYPALALLALCVLLQGKASAGELETALSAAITDMRSMPDQTKEYATALIQTDERIIYAPIVAGDNDSFKLSVSLHKGDKIVALLHTHPGTNSSTRMFSPQDISMAQQLKVPSYIYLITDGTTMRYAPGSSNAYGHKVSL
jgi:hypothetical protein